MTRQCLSKTLSGWAGEGVGVKARITVTTDYHHLSVLAAILVETRSCWTRFSRFGCKVFSPCHISCHARSAKVNGKKISGVDVDLHIEDVKKRLDDGWTQVKMIMDHRKISNVGNPWKPRITAMWNSGGVMGLGSPMSMLNITLWDLWPPRAWSGIGCGQNEQVRCITRYIVTSNNSDHESWLYHDYIMMIYDDVKT